MKTSKLLITVALIATMLTSVAGCKNSSGDKSQGNGDSTTLQDANFSFLSQEKEEIMRDVEKYPVFATAIKNYEEKYHGKVQFIVSTYSEKQGKLSAMIASGSAPDLYQPIDGYPQFAINGYAQPVDDLINLKDPIWKDVKDAYDSIEWKGKHNFVVVNKGADNLVWYNKALFENNGLQTPYELYKEGNWNWNTFRDAAIKLTQDTDGDKVIDQWGYSSGPEALIATTGKDLIKINGKDGTMTNNMKDQDIVKAFTFFQESGPAKYNVIQPDLNAYMQDFAKGKLAMFIGATWADTVWWADMAKKGECSFVPAPKYPDGSDYYVGGSCEYWMIPKGAKNPKAAAAFLTELRKASMDPTIQKNAEDLNIKNRGWKDQEIEMTKELKKLKYTYSYFGGVGNCGSDRWGMWYDMRVAGTPVQTVLEKHFNVWQNEIDIATGKIKLQHNEIAASAGTPKIDGEIDDAWKNAQEIVTDALKSPDDVATAKVKLLYDADTLYVLAQVSDPKVLSDNANAWECDSIEFFIDENKTQGSSYDSNTFQLRIGADGKMTGSGTDWDKRTGDLTSAVKKVDGGYIIEAAYKFKSVKAKAGSSMGFNIGVNDERETGKRYGTSVWNPDGGSSYSSPNKFGIVNFK